MFIVSEATQTRYERRRARTRQALLDSARRLFASKGFEATTIAQIAEEADTAHGSFYNHFRTKDEVLAAIFEETLSRQLEILEARRGGVEDPAERVSIGHRNLLASVRTDAEWGWLLLRLEIPHRIVGRVLGKDAMKDLRTGIETGRFKVADPEVALNASGGALIGVVHLILDEGRGEDADVAHVEGVLRSLGLRPAEAARIARKPLPEPLPR